MSIRMNPAHWLGIAGAGGLLSVLYVGIVIGDTLDGQTTTVTPQINSVLVVWPAAAIASIVILASMAKMLARRARSADGRFDAIDRKLGLLEQTRELPQLRIVGTAVVSQSAAVATASALPADNVLAFELGRTVGRPKEPQR